MNLEDMNSSIFRKPSFILHQDTGKKKQQQEAATQAQDLPPHNAGGSFKPAL